MAINQDNINFLRADNSDINSLKTKDNDINIPKINDLSKSSNGVILDDNKDNNNYKDIAKKLNKIILDNNNSDDKLPTINILAAGGCGISIIQKFLLIHKDTDDYDLNNVNVLSIDTSVSNLIKLNDFSNTQLYKIDSGAIGAGKKRSKNLIPIKSSIENLITDIKYKIADVNLLIFSTSGGSGSVIGPTIIKKLLELNKSVIAITISSSDAKIDIINNLNTLKNLHTISKNYYLPIMIFDNIYGRDIVDNNIINVLNNIFCIYLNHNYEMDYEDKSTFLSPNKLIKDINTGLHNLLVSNKIEIKENKFDQVISNGIVIGSQIKAIDSILMVSKEINTLVPSLDNLGVFFKGYNKKIKNEHIVLSILSTGIPQNYLNDLNEKLKLFNLKKDNNLEFNNDIDDEIDI